MNIVFFGTPQFSTPFLSNLIHDDEINVLAVVCQPDKPSGRGNKLTAPPIKLLAEQHDIKILQPKSLKKNEIANELRDLGADAFVVVAYGKLIPKQILDIPTLGCINVHPSLLPKHRGPSPMQFAIAKGDADTGISIMLLDEGMDTGPILAFEAISLDSDETYQTLEAKVHHFGPKLLAGTLKRHNMGEITPIPQNDAESTISRLLEREDGHINWTDTMTQIERKHRAYQPWPGSWSTWNRADENIRLKFTKLKPADFNADLPPGAVLIKNNQLFVDCSDGTIEILEIQPEGKPPMSASAFTTGHPDINDVILSS